MPVAAGLCCFCALAAAVENRVVETGSLGQLLQIYAGGSTQSCLEIAC